MAKKRSQGWSNGAGKKRKTTTRAKSPDKKAARSAGTRTVKANGGLPEGHAEPVPEPTHVRIGEAMRLAVEELGDVKIDRELAPQQLSELADCYEEITRRQAAFNEKADEAKTAKKSLESATNLLLEKVRAFTHPKPLPLFDHEQAEDDLGAMTGTGSSEREEALFQ